MPKGTALVPVLIFALLAAALGQTQRPAATQTQTPQAAPSPTPQDDDEVVRITTNLVQVDAVVTDREGRQVTDLTAEDFELLENGRPRQVTNFSYIKLAQPTEAAPPSTRAA
ncbi:MAG TPA: hypothetical protein VJ866_01935, partial [Pyrinomonadaceae bacterium]|nr:hypothetical protein [Pyrinomonadaceae bacterium]